MTVVDSNIYTEDYNYTKVKRFQYFIGIFNNLHGMSLILIETINKKNTCIIFENKQRFEKRRVKFWLSLN